MSYVTQAQIETELPPLHLNDALDDDADGVADSGLLDAIISRAEQAVDAFLGGIFVVPFTTPPAVVKEAAFVFACEAIYNRRQILEKNPYKERADYWRTRLEKIGNGELPLDAATPKEVAPGVAITEDAAVDDTTR